MLDKQPLYVYGAYRLALAVVDRAGIEQISEQLFFAARFDGYTMVVSMPWLVVVDA